MCRGTIYFQRANKFWMQTADVTLNAYLNILHYVKMSVDERLVNVALGGELPCYKGSRFEANRIEQEKNLAYTIGLYYEEYYHDCGEAFYSDVHKNLKMRIALVLVYSEIEDEYHQKTVLPMVCCGVSDQKHSLIVVNPSDGGYREIGIDECRGAGGQWKLTIMNVPGMVKMKGMGIRAIVASAAELYQKRFFFFRNRYYMDMTGAAFFEYCRSTGLNLRELPGFLIHREKQLRWLYDLSALSRETMPEDDLPPLGEIVRLYETSAE